MLNHSKKKKQIFNDISAYPDDRKQMKGSDLADELLLVSRQNEIDPVNAKLRNPKDDRRATVCGFHKLLMKASSFIKDDVAASPVGQGRINILQKLSHQIEQSMYDTVDNAHMQAHLEQMKKLKFWAFGDITETVSCSKFTQILNNDK